MQTITTMAFLILGLVLPPMVWALDAETQALERAALCQAMPYRVECGGPPRRPAQPIAAPQSPARARPPQVTGAPTPAARYCATYAAYVQTIAESRDQGVTVGEALWILRIQPAFWEMPAPIQAAMEQATHAVYLDRTIPAARLRQIAETGCLAELLGPGQTSLAPGVRY